MSESVNRNPENLRPLADRVLVKKIEEDESVKPSGLIVVDDAGADHRKAVVVAVGPGKWVEGKRVPVGVSVGDTILYHKNYGTDVGSFLEAYKNEYMILHEEDLLAVVQS